MQPLPREADRAFEPDDVPLPIVHEDEDLIVIDKPAGLVMHPAPGNWRGTLLNGLLFHRPALAVLPRAGIVHRLDKDTSGLLVVARSERALASLVAQLADRSMSRRYLAVVQGAAPDAGVIDAPIGRDPVSRVRMAVVPPGAGRASCTRFTTLARWQCDGRAVSLVECRLDTGRTHQIRVHMRSLGHPLLGDALYGGSTQEIARQALHAWRLGLRHPADGTARHWTSDPPDDLCVLVRRSASDLPRSRSGGQDVTMPDANDGAHPMRDEILLPAWPAPPRVRALVTLRGRHGASAGPWGRPGGAAGGMNLGTHCGDDPFAVRSNRARLRAILPGEPVWLDQVHGVDVLDADATQGVCAGGGAVARADAAISAQVGRPLVIMTAPSWGRPMRVGGDLRPACSSARSTRCAYVPRTRRSGWHGWGRRSVRRDSKSGPTSSTPSCATILLRRPRSGPPRNQESGGRTCRSWPGGGSAVRASCGCSAKRSARSATPIASSPTVVTVSPGASRR